MRQTRPVPAAAGKPVPFPIILRFFLFLLALGAVQQSLAQPVAIGPDDISRLRQETEFSGDWSETDAFNLDRYITLEVTLQALKIPERAGNAVLIFTLEQQQQQKLVNQRNLPADLRFQATLQSADTVRFLQLSERDVAPGMRATLRGWPATRSNTSGSVFLVDDIRLLDSGKRFSLHAENPKMQSRRSDTATAE